jgi:hypothetical protein
VIVRRYGSNVLSVTPNFDARAMTEIGFTRDGRVSMSAEDFQRDYYRLGGHELTARAEGVVQGEVEEAALASLTEQLNRVAGELQEGQVLLVENEPGKDLPKTRYTQSTTGDGSEGRIRFEYVVDPPLRVGIHQRRSG